MHSCFHLESAIVPPPGRIVAVVAVVTVVVVDPSVGEASGRNTERNNDNYDNDRPPL